MTRDLMDNPCTAVAPPGLFWGSPGRFAAAQRLPTGQRAAKRQCSTCTIDLGYETPDCDSAKLLAETFACESRVLANGIDARQGRDAQRLDAEHESPARGARGPLQLMVSCNCSASRY